MAYLPYAHDSSKWQHEKMRILFCYLLGISYLYKAGKQTNSKHILKENIWEHKFQNSPYTHKKKIRDFSIHLILLVYLNLKNISVCNKKLLYRHRKISFFFFAI